MSKKREVLEVNPTEVFNAVEAKRERLISLLKDLIRIPTVVPPGNNYEEMVDFLEPLFQQLGFTTERVVVPAEEIEKINSLAAEFSLPFRLEGPRVNLVASRNYGRHEPVTIYAHMDVVPVQEAWTRDPFNPVIEDGKLFGRGAIDMKYGIASMLVAIEVLHEQGLTPHFDIICTLCTDEEVGISPGIYYLAREGYVKGHVINMEGGDQEPVILAGMAGIVNVLIRTIGRSIHSGMNFLGVNAVEAMIPILNELQALKEEVEQRESAMPLHPVLQKLGAPFDKVTPMFNIAVIRGGWVANIVPAECDVVINRRYIPEESYDQVIKEIEEAVQRGKAKSKALDVKILSAHGYRPFKADITSKYALKMREALKAVHGFQDSDISLGGFAGSIDMGFIPQACDVDKIICIGAGTAENISAHQPDEYVCIDGLVNLTKQLVHYLAL